MSPVFNFETSDGNETLSSTSRAIAINSNDVKVFSNVDRSIPLHLYECSACTGNIQGVLTKSDEDISLSSSALWSPIEGGDLADYQSGAVLKLSTEVSFIRVAVSGGHLKARIRK
jgi:hypothetical protein